MKIGCPTWLVGTKKLSEATRFVAEAGFGAAAFLNNIPNYDPDTIGTKTYQELEPTAEIIKDYNLDVHIHIAPIGIVQTAEESKKPFLEVFQEEIRLICDWVKTTGQGKVVSFDPLPSPLKGEGDKRNNGFDKSNPYNYTGKNLLCNQVTAPRMVELLQITADLLQDTEIKVGIENAILPEMALPEKIEELILSVDRENLGVHFDTGHANIVLRQDWMPLDNISEYVSALKPNIVEVHLHDNDGKLDEHLLPGEGNADLLAALRALKNRDYEGTITVETIPRDTRKQKQIIQEAKTRTEQLLKVINWC